MRGVIFSLVMTVAVLVPASLPVQAQDAGQPDNAPVRGASGAGTEIRASEIKAPWDFAPPQQVISGRDLTDFRKDGTLLSKASREVPKVDEGDLQERKLAMYSGQRFHDAPLRAADDASRAVAAARKLARKVEAPGTSTFGWVGWTLLAVLAATVLVAWWRGWFVPFSVRAQEKHALRAASGKPRGREAKGPRMILVRRR